MQALASLRSSRDVSEARAHAAALQRLTAATRASLEQHVTAEERELWPLFAENFTSAEQEQLVGIIVGRTGAEVLQTMLPWVTGVPRCAQACLLCVFLLGAAIHATASLLCSVICNILVGHRLIYYRGTGGYDGLLTVSYS